MLTKKEDNLKEGKGSTLSSTTGNYALEAKKDMTLASKTPSKKEGVTRIIIKYDVGFGNQLFIRGKGANLSWDKGILLKNISSDEWVWESNMPFNTCEFKILINDFQFELGENRRLDYGASIQYTPRFFTS